MKKLIPLFILFCIGCSQTDNNTFVVGSADKMDILYIGIDNPVDIAVSGIPANQVKATVDSTEGKIEGGNGKYIVKVTGKKLTIRVYKLEDDKKETLLDSFKYRIKRVPNPVTSLAGLVGEWAIKRDKLLQTKEIETNWAGLTFDMNIPIVYYTMSIPVNGKEILFEEDGPAINETMKKYIRKMKEGEKVVVEDVKVKTPDGIRKIEGLVLKVRDN